MANSKTLLVYLQSMYLYPNTGKDSKDKKEELKNLVLRYGTEIVLVKNIKQDSSFVEGLQLYDK